MNINIIELEYFLYVHMYNNYMHSPIAHNMLGMSGM